MTFDFEQRMLCVILFKMVDRITKGSECFMTYVGPASDTLIITGKGKYNNFSLNFS